MDTIQLSKIIRAEPPELIRADSLMTMKQVTSLMNLSLTSLWRMINNNQFPNPVRIGPKSLRVRGVDYLEFVADPETWCEDHKNVPKREKQILPMHEVRKRRERG